MEKSILVDTDIIINLLRGHTEAVRFFSSNSEGICFSAVSVAEIYAGIKSNKEESAIERLFSAYPVLPVTNDIAKIAGKVAQKYRASHGVEIPDALIAATCVIHKLSLQTLNCKHYPMFQGIKPAYKKK